MTEFFNAALFNDAASRVNLTKVTIERYPLRVYSPELDAISEYEAASIRDYLRYTGAKNPSVSLSHFKSLYKRESRIAMFEKYGDEIDEHNVHLAVYYIETQLGENNETHSIPWMNCIQFLYNGHVVGNHAGSMMFPICHPSREERNPDICFTREEKEGLLIASTQALFQGMDGFTVKMPWRGQNVTHTAFMKAPIKASFDMLPLEEQIVYFVSNNPDLNDMMRTTDFRLVERMIEDMLTFSYDGARGVKPGNLSTTDFVDWGFRTHKHAFINNPAVSL